MYVTERPLTFADLTKAVQRSAGLGQAICYDDNGNVVDCSSPSAVAQETPYPIVTSGADTSAATGGVVSSQNQQGLQIGNTFVSLTTLGIAGALLVGAAIVFGGRR